jgi:predicted N-acyltransferase
MLFCKLLSAVPFTPGTGNRLLIDPDIADELKLKCYDLIIDVMKGLTINNKLLSANVNFMLEQEIPYFIDKGFDLRQTVQYR